MPLKPPRPDRHVPGFVDARSARLHAQELVGGGSVAAITTPDFDRVLAYIVVPATQGCPCCMKLETARAP